MLLIVSYLPKGHVGEPLMTEILPSDSYNEVIDAACDTWRHLLPPASQILSRTLARRIRRANGSRWVTLQPERFASLVRSGGLDELEVRLQVERRPLASSSGSSFGYDTSTACTTPDSLPEYFPTYGLHDTPASLFVESVQMLTAQLTPQCPFELFELEQQKSLPAEQLGLPAYSSQITVLTMFDKGLAAFLAGRHTEAQSRFQLAAGEFHDRGDFSSEADSLLHLGMSFRYSKDFVTARSSLLAAQSMYTALGSEYRAEQLQCARHLARVEEDRGNRHQALVAYQELLLTTEREGFITQHYWCLYYLGHLYNRMKMYEEAANALKDVVNKSRETCDGEMEGFATEELGYTAELQRHPRLAMSCYEKALQLFKINGESRWVESERRVKKRMDQLRHGYPELLRVEETWGWSIGVRV